MQKHQENPGSLPSCENNTGALQLYALVRYH